MVRARASYTTPYVDDAALVKALEVHLPIVHTCLHCHTVYATAGLWLCLGMEMLLVSLVAVLLININLSLANLFIPKNVP